ncbi:MAG: ABC transporter permease [Erysipelotrichaceae bacterium]
MSRVFKAELYKLAHSRMFMIALFGMCCATIGTGFNDPQSKDFARVLTTFSNILPILTAILVIHFAQEDLHEGTLKNYVCSGVSRNSIYFGKLLGTFVGTSILFVVEALTSLGLCLYLGGKFAPDLAAFIPTVVLQLVVCLNYTVIFFFIGTLISNSGIATILSLLYVFFGGMAFRFAGNYIHLSGLASYALPEIEGKVDALSISSVTMLHLGIVTIVIAVFALLGSYLNSLKDVK